MTIAPLRTVAVDGGNLQASGSFAQGYNCDGLVVMQGQCALTLDGYRTGELVGVGDPAAQTRQAIDNIEVLMRAAGGDLSHVVKIVVYVTDRRFRDAVYPVINERFPEPRPCSTGLVVSGLALEELLVEIDAWGYIPDQRAR